MVFEKEKFLSTGRRKRKIGLVWFYTKKLVQNYTKITKYKEY